MSYDTRSGSQQRSNLDAAGCDDARGSGRGSEERVDHARHDVRVPLV